MASLIASLFRDKHMKTHWLLRWAGSRLFVEGEATCLNRRRLFILPSRAGLTYAALVGVLLLVAMNYNNNMVFAFTFLLGSMGLNAMWQTHRNLLGLCIEWLEPEEIFADRPAKLKLRLKPGKRPRRALEFSWETPGKHQEPVLITAELPALAELTLPPMKRGLNEIPVLRLASRYPLGIFRAWTLLRFKHSLLVYPAPSKQAPPLPQAPVGSGRKTSAQRITIDPDYDGLRPYQSGDPPRLIAWRASARGDALFSKRMQGETMSLVWLDWMGLEGRDTEERLSILCRWILEADRRQLAYGLRLPDWSVAPALGIAHRRKCLRQLALYETIR